MSRFVSIRATQRALLARGVGVSRGARLIVPTRPYSSSNAVKPLDTYLRRHNGSSDSKSYDKLLGTVSATNVDAFVQTVIPKDILNTKPLAVEPMNGLSESELTARLRQMADKNAPQIKSFIGKGYYGTITPPVIQRNILECPEWYTSYTPYQPEISQGRLESLMNYQTLVSDLTGMTIANASLLDEATAAAEAMAMQYHALKGKKKVYYVQSGVHAQSVEVLRTRAEELKIDVQVVDEIPVDDVSFGCLLQYPATDGSIESIDKLKTLVDALHAKKQMVAVASDLLALTVLQPPSVFGADIVVGSAQRFGVPMGYGGPHAAFFAVADEQKRKMPGRLVGKTKDRLGGPAYRLALQTREQHIRRENATSNICTAQALLANMAAMYAVYHGPKGLQDIAKRVYSLTTFLAAQIEQSASFSLVNKTWFDTLTVKVDDAPGFVKKAVDQFQLNICLVNNNTVSLSLDETVTEGDMSKLLQLFGASAPTNGGLEVPTLEIPAEFKRASSILASYPVFHKHHSETHLLRYIHSLQAKDLSLANSMIPLGSCTMKLNATVTMAPITWPEFGNIHPFAPAAQAEGYLELIKELEQDLATITGFAATSLQPNSGAQGEFTGLKVIRAYLDANGKKNRDVCLIPVSAHGTNPASAAMAGMKVVSVKCKPNGELDLADLEAKAIKFSDRIAATMITYPSTFGVFEPGIKRACEIVHQHGGQVYMDGANMNAQIGLTSPGFIGADVCHLNLHKTFCIPHGGGGPGVGPICVKEHLAEFLPGNTIINHSGAATAERSQSVKAVSAAPFGSASILPIPWAYIKMMGGAGLKKATELALLNANYMRTRLADHYPVLYTNAEGQCAHEFILDMRQFKATAGIEAIDVAKRLQDYGFHAPTMSFPVANTLMIEPTESESIDELDRFCEALIAIRGEIADIESGKMPKENNVLKNAPHSAQDLAQSNWDRPYTRESAVYPLPYVRANKFWPSVTRVDDTYGDLNLFCSCDPVDVLE